MVKLSYQLHCNQICFGEINNAVWHNYHIRKHLELNLLSRIYCEAASSSFMSNVMCMSKYLWTFCSKLPNLKLQNQNFCKMASGGSPYDDFKGRKSDYKPKSNRKPPRFGASFEAELSLNSELQRSESEERRSLPNNLVCVLRRLNKMTNFMIYIESNSLVKWLFLQPFDWLIMNMWWWNFIEFIIISVLLSI